MGTMNPLILRLLRTLSHFLTSYILTSFMADLTNIFLFVATAWIGMLSWVGNRELKRVDSLESNVKENTKDIQTIKDVNGIKLESLEKKIDKIESAIETLASNLHKEKNQENQLTIAITKLYQYLEEKHK